MARSSKRELEAIVKLVLNSTEFNKELKVAFENIAKLQAEGRKIEGKLKQAKLPDTRANLTADYARNQGRQEKQLLEALAIAKKVKTEDAETIKLLSARLSLLEKEAGLRKKNAEAQMAATNAVKAEAKARSEINESLAKTKHTDAKTAAAIQKSANETRDLSNRIELRTQREVTKLQTELERVIAQVKEIEAREKANLGRAYNYRTRADAYNRDSGLKASAYANAQAARSAAYSATQTFAGQTWQTRTAEIVNRDWRSNQLFLGKAADQVRRQAMIADVDAQAKHWQSLINTNHKFSRTELDQVRAFWKAYRSEIRTGSVAAANEIAAFTAKLDALERAAGGGGGRGGFGGGGGGGRGRVMMRFGGAGFLGSAGMYTQSVLGLAAAGGAFSLGKYAIDQYQDIFNIKNVIAAQISTFNRFRDQKTGEPLNPYRNFEQSTGYSNQIYSQLREKVFKAPLTLRDLTEVFTSGYPMLAQRGVTAPQAVNIATTIAAVGKSHGLEVQAIKDDIRDVFEGRFRDAQTFQYAGFTPAEFTKLGKMSGPDFVKEFTKRFEGFNQSINKFGEGFTAKWTNMIDRLQITAARLGEKIAPMIIEFTESVNTTLDKWERDGTLDKFGNEFRNALEVVKDIGEKMVQNLPTITTAIKTYLVVQLLGTLGSFVAGLRDIAVAAAAAKAGGTTTGLAGLGGAALKGIFGVGTAAIATTTTAALAGFAALSTAVDVFGGPGAYSTWAAKRDASNAEESNKKMGYLFFGQNWDESIPTSKPSAAEMATPVITLLQEYQKTGKMPFNEGLLSPDALKDRTLTDISNPQSPYYLPPGAAKAQGLIESLIKKNHLQRTTGVALDEDSSFALVQAWKSQHGIADPEHSTPEFQAQGERGWAKLEAKFGKLTSSKIDALYVQQMQGAYQSTPKFQKDVGDTIAKLQKLTAPPEPILSARAPAKSRLTFHANIPNVLDKLEKMQDTSQLAIQARDSLNELDEKWLGKEPDDFSREAFVQNRRALIDKLHNDVLPKELAAVDAKYAFELGASNRQISIYSAGQRLGEMQSRYAAGGKGFHDALDIEAFLEDPAHAVKYNPNYNGPGHVPGSAHYDNRAVDVGLKQFAGAAWTKDPNMPIGDAGLFNAVNDWAAQGGTVLLEYGGAKGIKMETVNGKIVQSSLDLNAIRAKAKGWAPDIHFEIPKGGMHGGAGGLPTDLQIDKVEDSIREEQIKLKGIRQRKWLEVHGLYINAAKTKDKWEDEIDQSLRKQYESDMSYKVEAAQLAFDQIESTPHASIDSKLTGLESLRNAKIAETFKIAGFKRAGRFGYVPVIDKKTQQDIAKINADFDLKRRGLVFGDNTDYNRAGLEFNNRAFESRLMSSTLSGPTLQQEQLNDQINGLREKLRSGDTGGGRLNLRSVMEDMIIALTKQKQALEQNTAMLATTANRGYQNRYNYLTGAVETPAQKYQRGLEEMTQDVDHMSRAQAIAALATEAPNFAKGITPDMSDETVKTYLKNARLNKFSISGRYSAENMTQLGEAAAAGVHAFAFHEKNGFGLMGAKYQDIAGTEGLKRLLSGRGSYMVNDGKHPAYFDRKQYTNDMISTVGGAAANFLVGTMTPNKNYSGEGSQLGAMLVPMMTSALGPWGAIVGTLAGGLLGSLFRKHEIDPAIRDHQKRLEDLLSSINNRLIPQEDFFKAVKGSAIFAPASARIAGRTAPLALEAQLGAR